MVAAPAPVMRVEALGPLAVAVLPWAHQRPSGPPRHFLTIVAKVVFRLHERGECRVAPAEPVEPRDRAPLLPRAEVTLEGRCPAVGAEVLAQLRIARDGRELASRRAKLTVTDALADLGLLSGRAPDAAERRAILRGAAAPSLEARIVEIPSTFDLSYFQAAPLDQRVDSLHGDELIEIVGLGAPPTLLAVRLPHVRASAMVSHLAGRAGPVPVALAVDTVRIEMPACRVVVLLRGSCAVGPVESFDGLAVAGRLESPVAGPPYPSEPGSVEAAVTLVLPAQNAGLAPVRTQARTALAPTGTGELGERVERPALPFGPAARPNLPPVKQPSPDRARPRRASTDGPSSAAGPETIAPPTADPVEAASPPSLPFLGSRAGKASRAPSGAAAAPKSRRSSRGRAPVSAREPPPGRSAIEQTSPSLISKDEVEAARAWARGAPVARPAPVAPPPPVAPPAPAAPPAAVAPPLPVEAPPVTRMAGALARGRGADFLRGLRALDEDDG